MRFLNWVVGIAALAAILVPSVSSAFMMPYSLAEALSKVAESKGQGLSQEEQVSFPSDLQSVERSGTFTTVAVCSLSVDGKSPERCELVERLDVSFALQEPPIIDQESHMVSEEYRVYLIVQGKLVERVVLFSYRTVPV